MTNYTLIITDKKGNAYGIEELRENLTGYAESDFIDFAMKDIAKYIGKKAVTEYNEKGIETRDIFFELDDETTDRIVEDHFDRYLEKKGYKTFKVWMNGEVEGF